MDDNYFDPSPSPNLPEADPLRDWISQVQNDSELHKLMATDPQAAMDRMKTMGIPPPPQGFSAYTDGLGAENSIPGIKRQTMPGTYGGATPEPAPAPPYPQGSDPMTAGTTQPSILQRGADVVKNFFPTFGPNGKLQGNLTSGQGQPPAASAPAAAAEIPLPASDPRKQLAAALDPEPEPEVNPSAGQPLVPRTRPAEAGPSSTDLSAQSKKKPDTADALSGFSKSLAGVKPVPPPAPNFVGTPALPAHHAIQAPTMQNLLSLIGQPGQSPLALTLGRLLATGKA
jgi:hypothetical protein